MSNTTYPADQAEFEEYVSVMAEIAREIADSTPDPTPEDDDEEAAMREDALSAQGYADDARALWGDDW